MHIIYLKLKKSFGNVMLKLCQQKQKAGLEDCGSGLEWGDEGELTFQTVVDKRDWHSKQQHQDSSSSDEDDEEPRDMHMEVDTTDRTFLLKIFVILVITYDIQKKGLNYFYWIFTEMKLMKFQLGTLPNH